MPIMDFRVSSMSCGSCVATVTRALLRVQGVNEVHVDLEHGRVTVVTQGSSAEMPAMLRAFESAGYTAEPMDAVQAMDSAPRKDTNFGGEASAAAHGSSGHGR
ncbi:heavy-metal-associated domain-containing protein [Azohydromonas lata]|jgi:copper chaperone|uniref:heavy-metal-associated domain-containing protein n=1 Tax=Azohydromonas lata TaxID=45677 RepID=UPI000832DF2B|nr:heavy-metal-associated domain-containing protein [Azohydromonas lata]